MSYSYQWKRNGADIPGATSATYTLVTADVGTNISAAVKALNSAGLFATVNAAAVGPIVAATPANTALPVISGTISQGNILTTSQGTWTNTPTGYAYQWTRAGADIAGAITSGYTLAAVDVGTNIAVKVTASNAAGSTLATAAAVGPITATAGYSTYALALPFKTAAADGYWLNGKQYGLAYQELVVGGDFTIMPASSTVRGNITVSGGKLNIPASSGAGVDGFNWGPGVNMPAGTYRITFDIVNSISGGSSPDFRLGVPGNGGRDAQVYLPTTGAFTADYFFAGGTLTFAVEVPNSFTGSYSIDNLSIKQAAAAGVVNLPGYSYARSGAKSELGVAANINRYNLAGMADFSARSAATNTLLQSQSLDNASWAKAGCTVTANAATAPDGTTTADRLVTTASPASINQGLAGLTNATVHTASVFVPKTGGFSHVYLDVSDNVSNGSFMTMTVATGVLGASTVRAGLGLALTGYVVNHGTFWRFIVTYTTVATTGNVMFGVADTINTRAFVTNGNQDAWQLQNLPGNFADGGPIIPTTTAPRSIGIIESFAANEPAVIPTIGYQSRGALTNGNVSSQSFDDAAWTASNVTVATNNVTAPDGTATADTINVGTGAAEHRIYVSYPSLSGSVASRSLFVKAGTTGFIAISGGNAAESYAVFNVSTGVVALVGGTGTPSAYIVSCGGGWYRCILVSTQTTNNFLVVNVGTTAANTVPQQAFTGASETVALWQAQTIAGNFPDGGPIIATTTAALSLGADTLTHTIAAPTDVDQVFAVKFNVPVSLAGTKFGVQIDDATDSNRLVLYLESGLLTTLVQVAGVTQHYTSAGAIVAAQDTILVLRRLGGAWRPAKIVGGVLTWLSAGGAGTFPAAMVKNRISNNSGATAQLEGVIVNQVIKVGTFTTDADVIAAVTI